MQLEIPKSLFSDLFQGKVQMLHESIRYDKENRRFYLDSEGGKRKKKAETEGN
jgi:hypothetical protein